MSRTLQVQAIRYIRNDKAAVTAADGALTVHDESAQYIAKACGAAALRAKHKDQLFPDGVALVSLKLTASEARRAAEPDTLLIGTNSCDAMTIAPVYQALAQGMTLCFVRAANTTAAAEDTTLSDYLASLLLRQSATSEETQTAKRLAGDSNVTRLRDPDNAKEKAVWTKFQAFAQWLGTECGGDIEKATPDKLKIALQKKPLFGKGGNGSLTTAGFKENDPEIKAFQAGFTAAAPKRAAKKALEEKLAELAKLLPSPTPEQGEGAAAAAAAPDPEASIESIPRLEKSLTDLTAKIKQVEAAQLMANSTGLKTTQHYRDAYQEAERVKAATTTKIIEQKTAVAHATIEAVTTAVARFKKTVDDAVAKKESLSSEKIKALIADVKTARLQADTAYEDLQNKAAAIETGIIVEIDFQPLLASDKNRAAANASAQQLTQYAATLEDKKASIHKQLEIAQARVHSIHEKLVPLDEKPSETLSSELLNLTEEALAKKSFAELEEISRNIARLTEKLTAEEKKLISTTESIKREIEQEKRSLQLVSRDLKDAATGLERALELLEPVDAEKYRKALAELRSVFDSLNTPAIATPLTIALDDLKRKNKLIQEIRAEGLELIAQVRSTYEQAKTAATQHATERLAALNIAITALDTATTEKDPATLITQTTEKTAALNEAIRDAHIAAQKLEKLSGEYPIGIHRKIQEAQTAIAQAIEHTQQAMLAHENATRAELIAEQNREQAKATHPLQRAIVEDAADTAARAIATAEAAARNSIKESFVTGEETLARTESMRELQVQYAALESVHAQLTTAGAQEKPRAQIEAEEQMLMKQLRAMEQLLSTHITEFKAAQAAVNSELESAGLTAEEATARTASIAAEAAGFAALAEKIKAEILMLEEQIAQREAISRAEQDARAPISSEEQAALQALHDLAASSHADATRAQEARLSTERAAAVEQQPATAAAARTEPQADTQSPGTNVASHRNVFTRSGTSFERAEKLKAAAETAAAKKAAVEAETAATPAAPTASPKPVAAAADKSPRQEERNFQDFSVAKVYKAYRTVTEVTDQALRTLRDTLDVLSSLSPLVDNLGERHRALKSQIDLLYAKSSPKEEDQLQGITQINDEIARITKINKEIVKLMPSIKQLADDASAVRKEQERKATSELEDKIKLATADARKAVATVTAVVPSDLNLNWYTARSAAGTASLKDRVAEFKMPAAPAPRYIAALHAHLAALKLITQEKADTLRDDINKSRQARDSLNEAVQKLSAATAHLIPSEEFGTLEALREEIKARIQSAQTKLLEFSRIEPELRGALGDAAVDEAIHAPKTAAEAAIAESEKKIQVIAEQIVQRDAEQRVAAALLQKQEVERAERAQQELILKDQKKQEIQEEIEKVNQILLATKIEPTSLGKDHYNNLTRELEAQRAAANNPIATADSLATILTQVSEIARAATILKNKIDAEIATTKTRIAELQQALIDGTKPLFTAEPRFPTKDELIAIATSASFTDPKSAVGNRARALVLDVAENDDLELLKTAQRRLESLSGADHPRERAAFQVAILTRRVDSLKTSRLQAVNAALTKLTPPHNEILTAAPTALAKDPGIMSLTATTAETVESLEAQLVVLNSITADALAQQIHDTRAAEKRISDLEGEIKRATDIAHSAVAIVTAASLRDTLLNPYAARSKDVKNRVEKFKVPAAPASRDLATLSAHLDALKLITKENADKLKDDINKKSTARNNLDEAARTLSAATAHLTRYTESGTLEARQKEIKDRIEFAKTSLKKLDEIEAQVKDVLGAAAVSEATRAPKEKAEAAIAKSEERIQAIERQITQRDAAIAAEAAPRDAIDREATDADAALFDAFSREHAVALEKQQAREKQEARDAATAVVAQADKLNDTIEEQLRTLVGADVVTLRQRHDGFKKRVDELRGEIATATTDRLIGIKDIISRLMPDIQKLKSEISKIAAAAVKENIKQLQQLLTTGSQALFTAAQGGAPSSPDELNAIFKRFSWGSQIGDRARALLSDVTKIDDLELLQDTKRRLESLFKGSEERDSFRAAILAFRVDTLRESKLKEVNRALEQLATPYNRALTVDTTPAAVAKYPIIVTLTSHAAGTIQECEAKLMALSTVDMRKLAQKIHDTRAAATAESAAKAKLAASERSDTMSRLPTGSADEPTAAAADASPATPASSTSTGSELDFNDADTDAASLAVPASPAAAAADGAPEKEPIGLSRDPSKPVDSRVLAAVLKAATGDPAKKGEHTSMYAGFLRLDEHGQLYKPENGEHDEALTEVVLHADSDHVVFSAVIEEKLREFLPSAGKTSSLTLHFAVGSDDRHHFTALAVTIEFDTTGKATSIKATETDSLRGSSAPEEMLDDKEAHPRISEIERQVLAALNEKKLIGVARPEFEYWLKSAEVLQSAQTCPDFTARTILKALDVATPLTSVSPKDAQAMRDAFCDLAHKTMGTEVTIVDGKPMAAAGAGAAATAPAASTATTKSTAEPAPAAAAKSAAAEPATAVGPRVVTRTSYRNFFECAASLSGELKEASATPASSTSSGNYKDDPLWKILSAQRSELTELEGVALEHGDRAEHARLERQWRQVKAWMEAIQEASKAAAGATTLPTSIRCQVEIDEHRDPKSTAELIATPSAKDGSTEWQFANPAVMTWERQCDVIAREAKTLDEATGKIIEHKIAELEKQIATDTTSAELAELKEQLAKYARNEIDVSVHNDNSESKPKKMLMTAGGKPVQVTENEYAAVLAHLKYYDVVTLKGHRFDKAHTLEKAKEAEAAAAKGGVAVTHRSVLPAMFAREVPSLKSATEAPTYTDHGRSLFLVEPALKTSDEIYAYTTELVSKKRYDSVAMTCSIDLTAEQFTEITKECADEVAKIKALQDFILGKSAITLSATPEITTIREAAAKLEDKLTIIPLVVIKRDPTAAAVDDVDTAKLTEAALRACEGKKVALVCTQTLPEASPAASAATATMSGAGDAAMQMEKHYEALGRFREAHGLRSTTVAAPPSS